MMSMQSVVISGAGLWTPEEYVTNEELVDAYNGWVIAYNKTHAAEIEIGELEEKPLSSAEFIVKASGIKQRYTYCKDGILDIERMRPSIPERTPDELSHQAEMALHAAREAMQASGKMASEIDMVVVSCAYTQRAYPAIAIEVQAALGIEGFGFDMLVACSAATFALHRAYDAIAAGSAGCVLVINPELTTPQVNFRDRDGHFIFGDVATAMILERSETARAEHTYAVLGTKAVTQYSNNIRSDFGYLSYADDSDPFGDSKLFKQNGRKVFKEVCPMAAEHLTDQVNACGLEVGDVKRWWLHQANINMNELIARRLLGRDPDPEEAPIVLDKYANTASAGSVIAFNLYHEDLVSGDIGVLCSFGAGYSIGSLVLRKH